MLVVLRKDGESVCLFREGVEIKVKVNGRQGSRTSLAIDAPPEVKILREELKDRPPVNGATLRESVEV